MNPQDKIMLPIIAGIVAVVLIGVAVRAIVIYYQKRPEAPKPPSPGHPDYYLYRIDRKLTAVNIMAILMLISWALSCLFVAISFLVGGGVLAGLTRLLRGIP